MQKADPDCDADCESCIEDCDSCMLNISFEGNIRENQCFKSFAWDKLVQDSVERRAIKKQKQKI